MGSLLIEIASCKVKAAEPKEPEPDAEKPPVPVKKQGPGTP
jgi:hypothetical protein